MEKAGPSDQLSSLRSDEAVLRLFCLKAGSRLDPPLATQTTFPLSLCHEGFNSGGIMSRVPHGPACSLQPPQHGVNSLCCFSSSPILKQPQPWGLCGETSPYEVHGLRSPQAAVYHRGPLLGVGRAHPRVSPRDRSGPALFCAVGQNLYSDPTSFLPFINNFNHFNNVPSHG